MSPSLTHVMHIVAWALGAADVIIVALCLLFETH